MVSLTKLLSIQLTTWKKYASQQRKNTLRNLEKYTELLIQKWEGMAIRRHFLISLQTYQKSLSFSAIEFGKAVRVEGEFRYPCFAAGPDNIDWFTLFASEVRGLPPAHGHHVPQQDRK